MKNFDGLFFSLIPADLNEHWSRSLTQAPPSSHIDCELKPILNPKSERIPRGLQGNWRANQKKTLFLSVEKPPLNSLRWPSPGAGHGHRTDGIRETRNHTGEMSGKEHRTELIRRHSEEPAQAIVLAGLDTVEEFRGPDETADDITLMTITINA